MHLDNRDSVRCWLVRCRCCCCFCIVHNYIHWIFIFLCVRMYGFVLFSTLLSICLSVCPPASLSGFISLMVIYLSFSLRGVNDKPVDKSKACHHRNTAQLLIFWLAERSKLVAPKQMIIGLIWWTGDKTCVNIFCLWIKKKERLSEK